MEGIVMWFIGVILITALIRNTGQKPNDGENGPIMGFINTAFFVAIIGTIIVGIIYIIFF
jgi:hypothetical protein